MSIDPDLAPRIEALIRLAVRVQGGNLGARAPVSDRGDPVDDLAIAINHMLDRVESGFAGQLRFAADVSHELRTPLAAARMALDVALTRPRTPDEWAQAADVALRSLKQISSLVEAMLGLARADAGSGRREVLGVAELLNRVAEALGERAPDVMLAISAPPGLTVEGDADALATAFGHVVANALEHSPAGATVEVRAVRIGRHIQVDVDDAGAGIASADRERIFEPFARAGGGRADRTQPRAGVGFELAIARRIVMAHGGDVTVHDAPRGGARFRFLLPVALGE